jgi:hypothetical protein
MGQEKCTGEIKSTPKFSAGKLDRKRPFEGSRNK